MNVSYNYSEVIYHEHCEQHPGGQGILPDKVT